LRAWAAARRTKGWERRAASRHAAAFTSGHRAFAESLEERRLLSATVTTLDSFPFLGQGGVAVDKAGNVYGGAYNIVFEIPAGTQQQQTLATFPGGAAGAFAADSLAIDAAGNVYDSGVDGIFELAAAHTT